MRKIWLFILIFILFTAIAAVIAGFLRGYKLSARVTSIERRIVSEGLVYEIISTGDNRLCLRKMTADGLVTGYYPLEWSRERGMYTAYHTIGVLGEEMYLYKYETTGNTPQRRGETVVAYNMTDGKSRIVAEVKSPGTLEAYDVYFAQNTSQGAVYFGYLSKNDDELMIRCIDADSGVESDFRANTPFPLSSISVAETGELFALSQDSFVYMLKGLGWTCLYKPLPHEAAANMTVGSNGEVYLFAASPEGARALISTPENRNFTPMDFNADGLIKLHIAQSDRWVGLDEQYRYVTYVGGEKTVTDTLRVSFYALWDLDSLLIVISGAAIATGLFAVVRSIVKRRRLHLLPKLLILILPIFTIGMYILVAIAEGYVSDVTQTGLRESILEYAYDTITEIDAERFAGIDWSAPFDDEYFIELRALVNKLSEYRLMDVRNGFGTDTHNAYVSFWVYRVDDSRVYMATGGHNVIGLEVKYSEYDANVVQRDEMLSSREPTSAYIGGSDSNIRWLAVLFPITEGDELLGYLEVARPLTAIDEAVYTVRRGILLAGVLAFTAVSSALCLLLAFSTKTLGNLRRGALAVSGGDYSVRVHSKSWDETGEIAYAFNNMAQSVASSITEITNLSRGYSRFVSNRLIELLGKETISAIHPGDYRRLTASHLLFYTDSFDNLRDEDFFNALGRFYDITIPCVASVGGLISRYSARGLAAMVESSPETALRAVLAVFAAFDRAGVEPCHVFMSYSGAMLGVTGNGEHLNMITVTRLVYESNTIGAAAIRFGTRLIVSQSAFEKMGEAAGLYNYRFLGFLRDECELRGLYDFFDCDLADVKVKKKATKERFENGVEFYYAGQFAKAQKIFIELVKEFPEDMASREFLRRSHAGIKSGIEPQAVIELR